MPRSDNWDVEAWKRRKWAEKTEDEKEEWKANRRREEEAAAEEERRNKKYEPKLLKGYYWEFSPAKPMFDYMNKAVFAFDSWITGPAIKGQAGYLTTEFMNHCHDFPGYQLNIRAGDEARSQVNDIIQYLKTHGPVDRRIPVSDLYAFNIALRHALVEKLTGGEKYWSKAMVMTQRRMRLDTYLRILGVSDRDAYTISWLQFPEIEDEKIVRKKIEELAIKAKHNKETYPRDIAIFAAVTLIAGLITLFFIHGKSWIPAIVTGIIALLGAYMWRDLYTDHIETGDTGLNVFEREKLAQFRTLMNAPGPWMEEQPVSRPQQPVPQQYYAPQWQQAPVTQPTNGQYMPGQPYPQQYAYPQQQPSAPYAQQQPQYQAPRPAYPAQPQQHAYQQQQPAQPYTRQQPQYAPRPAYPQQYAPQAQQVPLPPRTVQPHPNQQQ